MHTNVLNRHELSASIARHDWIEGAGRLPRCAATNSGDDNSVWNSCNLLIPLQLREILWRNESAVRYSSYTLINVRYPQRSVDPLSLI